MNHAGELHLVDILKRLHLIPAAEDLNYKSLERVMNDLLINSKDNLIIKSELEDENLDGGQHSELEGDLTRNLFTLICAMLGLAVKQRGRTMLDDRLLA
jgi:hypothetical protein